MCEGATYSTVMCVWAGVKQGVGGKGGGGVQYFGTNGAQEPIYSVDFPIPAIRFGAFSYTYQGFKIQAGFGAGDCPGTVRTYVHILLRISVI